MSLFWLSGRDTGLPRCRDWTREHPSGNNLSAPSPRRPTLRPRCPFADRKPEKHVATRKDRCTPRETIGSYCYGVKEAGNIGFPSPPSIPPCHAPPRRVVARTPAVPWQ